jgi:hypothetical protein
MKPIIYIYIAENGEKRTLVNTDNEWFIDGNKATEREVAAIFKMAQQGHGTISGGSKHKVLHIPENELMSKWIYGD